jgi:hypothetical protein
MTEEEWPELWIYDLAAEIGMSRSLEEARDTLRDYTPVGCAIARQSSVIRMNYSANALTLATVEARACRGPQMLSMPAGL